MKKLYSKLTIATIVASLIYLIFFVFQYSFAQTNKSNQTITSTINKEAQTNQEVIGALELQIKSMEKQIEAGQRNLDLWLELLTFILSVLIGSSIFSGLKMRELAKDELSDLRLIKEDIKRTANDAEDRLAVVNTKILEIENTAKKTKNIEEQMSLQLKDFTDKSDIALDDVQKKKLDDLISQTKNELQNSGIEAFKNLYLAKALKADSDKKWEDAIRLWSTYIDLNDNDAKGYYGRARGYGFLSKEKTQNEDLIERALSDYNETIRIDSSRSSAFNNRGNLFLKKNMLDEALNDYNEAIRINPEGSKESAIAYYNRSNLYLKLGKPNQSKIDLSKAKELDPEKYGKSN